MLLQNRINRGFTGFSAQYFSFLKGPLAVSLHQILIQHGFITPRSYNCHNLNIKLILDNHSSTFLRMIQNYIDRKFMRKFQLSGELDEK